MSWKCSGWVKEQTVTPSGERLLISEKFVWLVLADYHNTAKAAAWPSVPNLARECLMEERTCYRVISELERKLCIVRRRNGTGRGAKNEYLFVGFDVTIEQARELQKPSDKGCQIVTLREAKNPDTRLTLPTSERVTETRGIPDRIPDKNTDTNTDTISGDAIENKENQTTTGFRTGFRTGLRTGNSEPEGSADEAIIRETLRNGFEYDSYKH
ncbi:MAG: helix-turn-helix domain-containing protein [Terriglobia bacterium]|nr:helix-turn-helix domain-containing protein [Terriglobia bacterium]